MVFWKKKTTEIDDHDTEIIKRHMISDADREKSLQVRRERAEIKRVEQMQEAKVRHLEKEIEIAELQKNMQELKGEDTTQEDQIINMAMSKLLGVTGLQNPLDPGQTPGVDLNNFEDQILKNTETPGQEEKVPQTPPKEEPQPIETRFSDDQLKQNLPKMMNKDQIEFLKTLSEDEIFQVYDIAKTL